MTMENTVISQSISYLMQICADAASRAAPRSARDGLQQPPQQPALSQAKLMDSLDYIELALKESAGFARNGGLLDRDMDDNQTTKSAPMPIDHIQLSFCLLKLLVMPSCVAIEPQLAFPQVVAKICRVFRGIPQGAVACMMAAIGNLRSRRGGLLIDDQGETEEAGAHGLGGDLSAESLLLTALASSDNSVVLLALYLIKCMQLPLAVTGSTPVSAATPFTNVDGPSDNGYELFNKSSAARDDLLVALIKLSAKNGASDQERNSNTDDADQQTGYGGIWEESCKVLLGMAQINLLHQDFYLDMESAIEKSKALADHRYAIRVYDFIASWALLSAHESILSTTHLLDFLTQFADIDDASTPSGLDVDVVEQVALVQVFTEMARKRAGVAILSKCRVLDRLVGLLEVSGGGDAGQESVYPGFLRLAAVKFWGFFAALNISGFIETVEGCREGVGKVGDPLDLLAVLFERGLSSRDSTVVSAVLVAATNMSATSEGLVYLAQHKVFLEAVVKHGSDASVSAAWRVEYIRALSSFLSHASEASCSRICMDIYTKALGPRSFTLIQKWITSHGVANQVLASLEFLFEAVQMEAVVHQLADAEPVVLSLLDRDDEGEIVGWRWGVLKRIVKGGVGEAAFAPSLWRRVVERVDEGPMGKRQFVPQVALGMM